MDKNRKKNFILNILLIISIIIVFFLIFFPVEKETALLRIGAGDDMTGSVLEKTLETGDFSFEIEPYYLQDCWAPTAQWSLKSNVYDIAIVCSEAAKEFIDASDDFVFLGNVTENTDLLVMREDGGEKIAITHNKEHLKELLKKRMAEVEIIEMNPHSFTYAYESGEIDGFVLDIAMLNESIKGEITNLSEEDYISNVMIIHKDLLNTKELEEFLEAYNKMVFYYNEKPEADYFNYKYGTDERRNDIWKVKLKSVNFNDG